MSNEYVEPKFDGRIPLLKVFASMVNPSDESRITITLNTKGTIITGTMIGIKEYYEAIEKQMIGAVRSSTQEIEVTLKKDLQEMFDKFKQPPSIKELEEGYEFHFIYLKDAKFYSAGKLFPSRGFYWMGRIDTIDGFVLGSFPD